MRVANGYLNLNPTTTKKKIILAHVNAKLFQIRLLKREKGAFWIMIRLESLIL